MPIAAKLFFFQRHRPPPPAPDPTDPLSRGTLAARLRSTHHMLMPGYEIARGSHRGRGASSGSIIEPTSSRLFRSRLSTNTSNDRLPDAVKQAKERLRQRLRSVDLSLGRRSASTFRQTTRASGTVCAGPSLPSDVAMCTSEDGRLDSLTIRFNSSASLSTHKVKEMTAEPFRGAGKDTAAVVAPHPEPASKLGQEIFGGTIEGGDVESSVDCSICLEGCHGAGGLIQLRCKHIFHSACLERWLRSRGDCPYCRASVVLTQEE